MAALRTGRSSLAAQSVRAVRSLLAQRVAHTHSALLQPTPAYATSRRLHVSVGGPGSVIRTCAEALGISSRRLRRWSLRHTCNAFAAAPSTARQARARATLRSGYAHWRGRSRGHHNRAFSTAGGAPVAGDEDDYVGDADQRHALGTRRRRCFACRARCCVVYSHGLVVVVLAPQTCPLASQNSRTRSTNSLCSSCRKRRTVLAVSSSVSPLVGDGSDVPYAMRCALTCACACVG